MAKVQCVLFVAIVAAVWSSAMALSDDEKAAIKAVLAPLFEECGQEHGHTKDEILAAKKAQDVDALKDCFYACVMKKTGLIDDKGLFAAEAAKENQRKFFKDEEMLTALDAISDDCAKVNKQDVSDGTEGCERAKMVAVCMKEHKDSISSIFD